MARRRLALSLVSFLFLFAAKQRAVRHPELLPSHPPADAFSVANTGEVTTRHLALDLTVDFEQRKLAGTATLTIENLTGAKVLVLDTFGLDIESVTLDGSTPALWSYGTAREFSRPLQIGIQPSTRTVTIRYETMQDAPGLNWNSAAQSFGRKEPYLFSLNEPIDARGWIPIQDTPSMRMTWEATLRVPPQLLALMSAENNPTSTNAAGIYTFRMTKTVPAYLIALAVGRLEFHPFDERTGVYAEPELMSDAALELQYLPDMVDTAERIIAPYPFVRYDVLLMPPTFTAGGMEHPMLNFINPFSVVTGNHPAKPEPRSLIAHELSHSWSGDAVTLANWNDVWLNEGITSYLTLRIMEEMVGAERAELTYFLDRASYTSYAAQPVNRIASVMHREVAWPGDGFGSTGYVKGELFLRTLEDLLGRSTLDAFLDVWFSRFAFRWVDDATFIGTLAPYIRPGTDLRLQQWLYEPGLPSNVTAATSSAIYNRVLGRAQAFNSGIPIAQLAPTTWSETEIDLFLSITASLAVRSRMPEIDAALSLSSRNAPPSSWLTHAAAVAYAPAMPAIERILLRGGPNNQIMSLYNALRATPAGRAFAKDVFARARGRYHPSVVEYVEKLIGTFPSALREAA
ncbi:MAG TPA: leukotriene A4 hydrolase C-terminal domain-containing protein [Thermoanaerobaculia bacterium]|nr:leukotriene A4 hydrolase C-terminal domain-containing protein [Thermoanaerobaculia bacterium]